MKKSELLYREAETVNRQLAVHCYHYNMTWMPEAERYVAIKEMGRLQRESKSLTALAVHHYLLEQSGRDTHQ